MVLGTGTVALRLPLEVPSSSRCLIGRACLRLDMMMVILEHQQHSSLFRIVFVLFFVVFFFRVSTNVHNWGSAQFGSLDTGGEHWAELEFELEGRRCVPSAGAAVNGR